MFKMVSCCHTKPGPSIYTKASFPEDTSSKFSNFKIFQFVQVCRFPDTPAGFLGWGTTLPAQHQLSCRDSLFPEFLVLPYGWDPDCAQMPLGPERTMRDQLLSRGRLVPSLGKSCSSQDMPTNALPRPGTIKCVEHYRLQSLEIKIMAYM